MFEEEDEIRQMQEIVKNLYVARIEETYGDEGLRITEELTSAISNIYVHLDRNIFNKIVIIKSLSNNSILKDFRSITRIAQFSILSGKKIIIEILDNNTFNVSIDSCENESIFSNDAIVYLKNETAEYFYIKEDLEELTKIGNLDTYFIKPTFKSLDEALDNYKTSQARTSKCLILRKNVWKGGISSNRVVFKPGPEHIMRDSLFQFLDVYIRGNKEVMREQNVNEKNPIDIRITWNYTNHVALIEIKWIGLSSSGSGYTGKSAITRSNKGAKQLANYLDLFRTEQPEKTTRGYLVVFDGRRNNVVKTDTNVSFADGFHFENKEIVYNPDYSHTRRDFEKPIRFFMEAKY